MEMNSNPVSSEQKPASWIPYIWTPLLHGSQYNAGPSVIPASENLRIQSKRVSMAETQVKKARDNTISAK
jgi:hypothetical protein